MEKRGAISTIFCYLYLDFHVKTGTRISLRDKRLFEISEVEITRVDCSYFNKRDQTPRFFFVFFFVNLTLIPD